MDADSIDATTLKTPFSLASTTPNLSEDVQDGWQRTQLRPRSGAAAKIAVEALENTQPALAEDEAPQASSANLQSGRQAIDDLLRGLTQSRSSREAIQAHTRQLVERSARGLVSCTNPDDYKDFLSSMLFNGEGLVEAGEQSVLVLDLCTIEESDCEAESAIFVHSHSGITALPDEDAFLATENLFGKVHEHLVAYFPDDESSLAHPGSHPVDALLKEFDESVKAAKQMRFPIAINGSGVRGSSVLDQRQNTLRLLAGTLVSEEPSLKPVPALGIAAQIVAKACSPGLRHRVQQAAVQFVAAPTLVTVDEDTKVAETVVVHVGSGKHAKGWGTYIRFSRLSTFNIALVEKPEEPFAKLECEFAQDVVLDTLSSTLLSACNAEQPWTRGKSLKALRWTAPSMIMDISWITTPEQEEGPYCSEPAPAMRTSLTDPGTEPLELIDRKPETIQTSEPAEETILSAPASKQQDNEAEAERSPHSLQDLFRAVERRRAGEQQSLPMHTPVYSWGKGEYGALGHGLFSDAKLPVPAIFGLDLGLVRVKSISCSWFHSAAVSDLGLLYTWGSGNDGALGHGNSTSITTPQLVDFFGMEHPLAAVAVACGSDMSGAHTLVLTSGHETDEATEAASTADFRGPIANRVYSFGAGPGTGRSTSSLGPRRVRGAEFDAAAAKGIARIAAGGSCSAAVSNDGDVFTWGRWANGRLGLGAPPVVKAKKQGGKDKVQQLQLAPSKITFPKNPAKIVDIAAGEQHMLCVDSKGYLWSWGRGDSGQLGNGAAVDAMQPQRLVVREDALVDDDRDTAGIDDTASMTSAASNNDLETAASMYSDVLPIASIRSSQRSVGSSSQRHILFVSVAAGVSHSMAISADGGLFTWGGRGGAMLGHGDQHQKMAAEEDQNNEEATLFELVQANSTTSPGAQTKRPYLYPRRVRALCGSVMGEAGEVLAADGGAAHSIAVTAAGELFIWGDNEDNALGTNEPEVIVPQLVNAGSNLCAGVEYAADGRALKHSIDSNGSDEYFYGSHMRTELTYLVACSGWHTHVVTLGSSLGVDLQAAAPPAVRGQLRGFRQHTASTVGHETAEDTLTIHDGASTLSKTATYATHSSAVGAFDTLLRVESGSVFAHKCVLAARSPHFAALINEEEVSDRVTEISLPDVPLRVLLVILEFIYTDNLCVPLSPVSPDLLIIQYTAETYGLTRLAYLCKAMASSAVAPLVYNEGPADEDTEDGDEQSKADLFDVLEAPTLLVSTTKSLINAEWADTVFVAGGERLQAHRAILCSRSEYFAALFKNPSRSLQTAIDDSEEVGEISATDIIEIEVPDRAWEFRRLLCFLYTSTLPSCTKAMLSACSQKYDSDIFLNDLILADKYSIIRMKNAAESMVAINRFNAAKAFVVADMVSAPRLRERAALFLVSHVGQVIETVAWNNLQTSRPDLVSELQTRIRERNRVYLGPAATVKTKAELRMDEEAKKNEDLLENAHFSWTTLAALLVVGILYLYVSVYNTSFGNVVPALNVVVLLSAIILGMKNLAE